MNKVPFLRHRVWMFAFTLLATFTTGDCPSEVIQINVKEGDDIVLQCDTKRGTNHENDTVDLQRFNKTTREFEDLLIYRHHNLSGPCKRCSFNPDGLKRGVVTATINNSTLLEGGRYRINLLHLNEQISRNFNVTVTRHNSTGQEAPTNTTKLGIIIGGVLILIAAIVFIVYIVVSRCIKKISNDTGTTSETEDQNPAGPVEDQAALDENHHVRLQLLPQNENDQIEAAEVPGLSEDQ